MSDLPSYDRVLFNEIWTELCEKIAEAQAIGYSFDIDQDSFMIYPSRKHHRYGSHGVVVW